MSLKNNDSKNNTSSMQLVTFQMGSENYGVDIMEVDEIHSMQSVHSLPHSPSYVEGILNLRGEIIPIINLHDRFTLTKIKKDDDELLSGFVIMNVNNTHIGIVIDRILRVITVELDDILPPPQILSGIGHEFVKGVINQPDGGYLIVLNTYKLFDAKELANITEML